MGVSLTVACSWLPSVPVAAAVSLAGAAAIVYWIFLDHDFPQVAELAAQDLRLRFLHDAAVRFEHRWNMFGPRMAVFGAIAGLSGLAGLAVFARLAFGSASQRSIVNVVWAIAVLAVWIALSGLYRRLWWLAFRRRVVQLLPAMKAAVPLLEQRWPEADVFLPGLGNYGVSSHDPNHFLHADPSPAFGESVGGISRVPDACIVFGIELSFGYCVEYRMNGWSPKPVSVRDCSVVRATLTARFEGEWPLGDNWYLAYYTYQVDVRDEIDPEIVAEIARRPPGLRLPHQGGRFRAREDAAIEVHAMYWFPGLPELVPMSIDRRTLPCGEVLRLEYEPDPSQSTHCHLVAENRQGLEAVLVDPKDRKHRDYRGYRMSLSYIELDEHFEWLEAGSQPANR